MAKKSLLLLTLVMGFIVGIFTNSYLLTSKINNQEPTVSQAKINLPSSQPKSSVDCLEHGDYEIQGLDTSFKKVENNPTATKIIKDNCLSAWGSLKGHIDNTGKENLVFWASPQSCGACHGVTVYVLKEDKIFFEKGADNPEVEIVKNNGKDELKITEPLRRRDEGLCCPSWGITTTYGLTADANPTLYAYDETPYDYSKNNNKN